ncbi:hypothetical protein [Lentibacillus salinarum]|uniref:Uncharacterized protein n=1 Tax=Lentibacillus salinarum TaxID=446820 RepID=A0ABW3ZTB6_9BACI
MDAGNLLKRKITVTFVVTVVTSIFLAFLTVDPMKPEPAYNMGHDFLGWASMFSLYAGAVILIYGNLVSVGLEYLLQRGAIKRNLSYMLLHGVFGSAIGLIFQEAMIALFGAAIAIFYASTDRWLLNRMKHQKKIWLFYLFPILICGFVWGYLQVISDPLPPFTAEDAVARATDGQGTATDLFPEEIGTWEDTINGYHVERETSAEVIGNETYIVTFTESWQKEEEEGSFEIAYEVDRHSLTARGMEGANTTPPYYDN